MSRSNAAAAHPPAGAADPQQSDLEALIACGCSRRSIVLWMALRDRSVDETPTRLWQQQTLDAAGERRCSLDTVRRETQALERRGLLTVIADYDETMTIVRPDRVLTTPRVANRYRLRRPWLTDERTRATPPRKSAGTLYVRTSSIRTKEQPLQPQAAEETYTDACRRDPTAADGQPATWKMAFEQAAAHPTDPAQPLDEAIAALWGTLSPALRMMPGAPAAISGVVRAARNAQQQAAEPADPQAPLPLVGAVPRHVVFFSHMAEDSESVEAAVAVVASEGGLYPQFAPANDEAAQAVFDLFLEAGTPTARLGPSRGFRAEPPKPTRRNMRKAAALAADYSDLELKLGLRLFFDRDWDKGHHFGVFAANARWLIDAGVADWRRAVGPGGGSGGTCPHEPRCRNCTACRDRSIADGRAARTQGGT